MSDPRHDLIMLRKVLTTDAWVCFAYAVIVVAWADSLAHSLIDQERIAGSIDATDGLRLLGAFVFGMGIYAVWICHGWPTRIAHVRTIIAVEVLWCISCLLMLTTDALPLTAEGNLAVIASGLGVLIFLVAELWGYFAARRMSSGSCNAAT